MKIKDHANSSADKPGHCCLFYGSNEEKLALVLQRVEEALTAGERVLVALPPSDVAQVLHGLEEKGIDGAQLCGRGDLLIRTPEEFEELRVPRGLAHFINAAVSAGDGERRGTFIVADGQMWGMHLEHEEALGHLLNFGGARILCLYHLTDQLPATIMASLMHSHHCTILGRGSFAEIAAGHQDRGSTAFLSDALSLFMDRVSFDLAERRRAEEALAASEERFRRYFELGLIGMAVTSPEKRIIEVNDKACEILGYRRDELLGMTWPELTHVEDLAADTNEFQALLAGKKENFTLDKRFIRKDGTVIDAVVSMSCLRRKDGTMDSCVKLLQDVTDRKRAEREIAAYQQQLRLMAGEMYRLEEQERKHLAAVLHDQIGQNLALSKMKLESLKSWEDGEVLRQEIAQVTALLDGVIKSTRSLTSELRPPVLYELGLEAAVESLCEEFQGQTALAIDFRADGASGDLPDPLRAILFSGVRELLVNVMKHAKATRAEVSVTRKGSRISVAVADNGIGFDTARRSKGSFGLFSLSERLRLYGGGVEVISAPGQGTRVELAAPLEAPGRGGAAKRGRTTSSGTASEKSSTRSRARRQRARRRP